MQRCQSQPSTKAGDSSDSSYVEGQSILGGIGKMARGKGSRQRVAVEAGGGMEPRRAEIEDEVTTTTVEETVEVEAERLFDGKPRERAVSAVFMLIAGYRERVAQLSAQSAPQTVEDLMDLRIKAAGIIPSRDQRKLCAAAQAGSADARELLVACNQRAVRQWAKPYQGSHGLSMEDLIQEGNLGLTTAVDKYSFDFADKATFLTYARWWVKQSFARAIQEKGGQITLPSYMQLIKLRTERALRALEGRGIDRPSRQQIHDEVQATSRKPVLPEHIDLAVEHIGRRYSSMDAELGTDDGSVSLQAIIADPDAEADVLAQESWLGQVIEGNLDDLSPLQRTIIVRKFGLLGHQETSNVALMEELGLRKGKIDNEIKLALTKLRPRFEAAGLAPEILFG